jgi:para-aminobenzoate synthetase
VKTLLIDNYDSFTYNLYQLLSEANGEEPTVVHNDALSWAEIAAEIEFDNVVISPGPGSPEREADFGVCHTAIRESSAPLLGVCLGHQGLCAAYGARVVHAPEPMHGRLSAITHEDEDGVFAGLPREFQVVRYHSLCVEDLPAELRATARTTDGILMGVAHRERPQWGVQFHPESISTEHGRALLARFRDLTAERATGPRPAAARPPRVGSDHRSGAELELRVRRLDFLPDTERAFAHLYAGSADSFWLDSNRLDGRARFSFMGDASGPLASTVSYDVNSGRLTVTAAGASEVREESVFDHLSREMRRLRQLSDDLPFDFNCGFAGYFGYELKADCEGSAAHVATMPDAFFVFADRMIGFDHIEEATYVLGLCPPGEEAETDRWIAETALRLASLPPVAVPDWSETVGGEEPVDFTLARSHEQYLDDIATCKQRLIDGESYEICLTNRITAEVRPQDPFALYRTLRRVNPAPFSAFLRMGERAVLSSSPERFLSIGRDRWMEAKPIKGTVRRGVDPAEDVRLAEELRTDEKSRAENLMICDLLRNDLGVVCEVGTVHVPNLMHVETYETVHQLVSTVRGLMREDLEPPDCIRACFPGGSMTGAPKVRTMEIIDALEGEARGVYSGAIGYLGLSGGCDLNIVIRTVVMDGERTTLGVGGAIVMQSDAEEEYQETLLKARAPIAAIDPRFDPQRL